MKTLAITVTFLLLSSCCRKGAYPVAGLTVSYPNVTNTSSLKAIRTNSNDISSVLDTISLGELNSSNSFSAIITFKQNSSNYIVYIENTTYRDTISEINFKRKGCKEKIKDFEYKFNGEHQTETKLVIN